MFRVLAICSFLVVFANRTVAQEANYSVQRISVNSEGNEYAPVLRNGELLYTSDNRERLGMYFSSSDSAQALMNMYRAKRISDTLFGQPELLDNRLNRFYNSGPACIGSEGKHVFFSSNEATPFLVYTSRKKSKLHIYTSTLNGKKWSERTALPFSTAESNDTHPFVSASEDTLVFASDRPGGFGGYDLYRSVYRDGMWSQPTNLGAAVNTAADELFPFFSGKKLVFASDRTGGFGKLDLYVFSYGRTTHLAAPFNSPADDFGYFALDEKKGYFSSNRSGNDELWFYRELFPAFHDCTPYVRDPFCFTFFEETEEIDDGLDLAYEWNLGDGTIIREREAKHCFAGYGEYLVELNIVDRTTSEVYYTQASYPFAIAPTERLHLEGPDTIPPSADITYSARNSSLPGYEIEQFYWELDQGAFRKSNADTVLLSITAPGAHQLVMGVAVRPEGGGEPEEFCVSKTIIVQEGHSLPVVRSVPVLPVTEAEPEIVPDTAAKQYTLFLGVSDTLIGHLSLHKDDSLRVESVGDSLYVYSVGASNDKFGLISDFREAQEMGFTDSRVTELQENHLPEKEQLAQTTLVRPDKMIDNRILNEQILTTFELFYGYNVFTLTDVSRKQLSELVSRYSLKPHDRVLITSFTDSKGNDAYNLSLSKKRSESVKRELMAHGYPADRIELEYYGRRVPADMEPLTDAQRRKSLIIIYEKE